MRRHLAVAAAVLCGAAAGVVVPVTSASAAACAPGTGVTVVVGSQVSCDANGGGSAAGNMADTGHALIYVQRQPGFVCQVDGAPASSPCVQTPPANAYWAIFVSDGKTGTWSYANLGIQSLTVPDGGWLGMRFQNTSSTVPPSVKPAKASAGPGGGSTGGGSKGDGSSSGGSGKTATPTPTAATTTPTPTPSATTPTPTKATPTTPTPTPSRTAAGAQAADDLQTTAAEQDEQGSSSLVWVAVALAVLLAGGMGAAVWQRRARGHTH